MFLKDITAEEYEFNKNKEKCTFRPAINPPPKKLTAKISVKSRGEEKSVERALKGRLVFYHFRIF